jgi:TldD protein
MNALLLAAVLSAGAGEGVALKALKAEVARAQTLSLPAKEGGKPGERPYFVSAVIDEVEALEAQASFGALAGRSHATNLVLSTRVRVGSAKFDNTNFPDYGAFMFGSRRRTMPAELDADLLRTSLWLSFDDAYKAALETLSKKRAYLETNTVTEQVDDFSPAPVFTVDAPRTPLGADADQVTQLVRKASGVFLGNRLLQEGTAALRLSSDEQNFASSEGATHRFGDRRGQLTLQVMAQASDGMELRLSQRFTGRDLKDLPDEATITAAAKALSERMTQLAQAPLADEDYAGPVLFVDQAAAVFFLTTVGEPLSNAREPLGVRQPGRMIDRLGKRVAARFMSVKDDPTLTTWHDVPLWGAFPVDDEGVQSQPVSLIEEGVLRRYYMSRAPTAKFKASNGHCRGEQGGVGNLFVSTSQPTPRAALKKRLLELAKDEDLDYGLLVESVDDRAHGSVDGTRLPNPVLVWRVAADGKETLVRGLAFKPASARMLKELEGLGDDPSVLNLEHLGQPTSVVAPSVLVKLLELTRTRQEFEKPPLLPRP